MGYFLNSLHNNLIAFDFIARVFPNCEQIHCFRTDPENDVFNGQGFMYLDSLRGVLERINQDKECQLSMIRIFGKRNLLQSKFSDFQLFIEGKTGWALNSKGDCTIELVRKQSN